MALDVFSSEDSEYRTAKRWAEKRGILESFRWFAQRGWLDDLNDDFFELGKEVDLDERQGRYILAHLESYVVDQHSPFPDPPETSIEAN